MLISLPAHHFLFIFLQLFTHPHLIILIHPSNYHIPQPLLCLCILCFILSTTVYTPISSSNSFMPFYKYASFTFSHLSSIVFKFSFIHTSTLSYPSHLLSYFYLASYPSIQDKKSCPSSFISKTFNVVLMTFCLQFSLANWCQQNLISTILSICVSLLFHK